MGILYRLTFASGKSYIGVTRASLRRRLNEHRHAVKRGGKQAIYGAWRKHGAPLAVVLAIIENDLLPEMERRAVNAFQTMAPLGYNMTPGGDISPMWIAQIANKTRGRKHSAESKAKMSAAKRGQKRSAEHTAKLIVAAIGRKASNETRDKMSKAASGHAVSSQTRSKIAASLLGRKHSAQRIARIKEGRRIALLRAI